MNLYAEQSPLSLVLCSQTTIQAKISDHNLLIKDTLLFLNMMMRCRWNQEKKRFNNGFGIIEDAGKYRKRIGVIVQVIAETISLNPQIDVIGLVEAPIEKEDVEFFMQEASRYPCLEKFLVNIYPVTSMGVTTFINAEKFSVQQIHAKNTHDKFKDRFQEFELKSREGKEMRLFNLHIPFDLAKSKESSELNHFISGLFNKERKMPTLVIGDFNVHPKSFFKKLRDIACFVQKNNNILIDTDASGKIVNQRSETVDGVLSSSSLNRTQPLKFFDATRLHWFGTDPIKEFHMLRSLFHSKIGFFIRAKACTHDGKKIVNYPHLITV